MGVCGLERIEIYQAYCESQPSLDNMAFTAPLSFSQIHSKSCLAKLCELRKGLVRKLGKISSVTAK